MGFRNLLRKDHSQIEYTVIQAFCTTERFQDISRRKYRLYSVKSFLQIYPENTPYLSGNLVWPHFSLSIRYEFRIIVMGVWYLYWKISGYIPKPVQDISWKVAGTSQYILKTFQDISWTFSWYIMKLVRDIFRTGFRIYPEKVRDIYWNGFWIINRKIREPLA